MWLVCAGALGCDGVVSVTIGGHSAVHVLHVHSTVTTRQVVLPHPDGTEASEKSDSLLILHRVQFTPVTRTALSPIKLKNISSTLDFVTLYSYYCFIEDITIDFIIYLSDSLLRLTGATGSTAMCGFPGG